MSSDNNHSHSPNTAAWVIFALTMLAFRCSDDERLHARQNTCAASLAFLVADTLCVRSDSAWRVSEPLRGGEK